MEELRYEEGAPGPGTEKVPSTPLPAVAEPEEDAESAASVGGEGYRVLLFNDDFHSMEEVILQIMKATRCPLDVAEEIMLRAHNNGQAVVVITSQEEAERVASVLRDIALVVQVTRA